MRIVAILLRTDYILIIMHCVRCVDIIEEDIMILSQHFRGHQLFMSWRHSNTNKLLMEWLLIMNHLGSIIEGFVKCACIKVINSWSNTTLVISYVWPEFFSIEKFT